MQTKRKNSIYIIFVGIALLLLLIWTWPKEKALVYGSNRALAANFDAKLKYYSLWVDSAKQDNFSNFYKKTTAVIAEMEGKIDVVGERIKIRNDSIVFETFVFQKVKSIYLIVFIQNVNGTVKIRKTESRYGVNVISKYCDAHYFYLPREKFSMATYDAYSFFVAAKEPRSVKIFLSDQFNPVSGVICPCDDWELADLIKYIDRGFESVN